MGSYLLIVAGPDETAPVRVPVFIARNADEAVDVHLYGKSEIPPGFVQVPGGRFPFQGDPENPNTLKATRPCLEDFFASVFPVTCREYGEFLDELHGTDPAQAERRVPREADASGPYWGFGPDGRIRLPRPSPGAEPPGGAESFPRRLAQAAADWAPDWPVLSISWLDAIAFCDWKSRREGRLFTLPLDVQWEKCARGVDGRPYPWGWYIDDCFCNSNRSVEGGAQPMPVGSFPIDESVHGVRGLGGNSRDWCLDAPLEAHKGWRFYRGGCWPLTGILNFRGSRRNAYQANRVYYGTGARLVMIPRLGKGPAAP
jgi:formylglycine-generating enzyme required for sulfatase activity